MLLGTALKEAAQRAPAAEANSPFGTVPGFRGAQANPHRSSGSPEAMSWLRIA